MANLQWITYTRKLDSKKVNFSVVVNIAHVYANNHMCIFNKMHLIYNMATGKVSTECTHEHFYIKIPK